jgi:hypothetical protein
MNSRRFALLAGKSFSRCTMDSYVEEYPAAI